VAEKRTRDRSAGTPTRLNTTPLSIVFRPPTARSSRYVHIIFKYFTAYAMMMMMMMISVLRLCVISQMISDRSYHYCPLTCKLNYTAIYSVSQSSLYVIFYTQLNT